MVFSESSMCGYLLSIEQSCKVQATLLEILVQMKKKKWLDSRFPQSHTNEPRTNDR